MKRTILFCMLAFCTIVLVSAQGNDRWGQGYPRGQGSHMGQGFHHGGQGFHHGGPGFNHRGPQSYSWGRGDQRNFPRAPENISVSGNLTIARGMIAVTRDGVTYLAGGVNRFVGFIDGLKEGAAVTLEGYASSDPRNDKVKFLRVQKMTIGGKDYELSSPRQIQQRGR